MMPTPTQRQIRRDRPLVRRMLLATCFLTLGFSAVLWRLYDLHLKRGPELAEMASAKFREIRPLPAQRGSIKDNSGRYLAYDEEIFALSTNRVHLNEPPTVKLALSKVRKVGVRDLTRDMSDAQIITAYQEHIASVIAPKLGISVEDALTKLHSKEQIEVLAEKMNEDQAREWKKLLDDQHIKGVYVRSTIRRHYPTENRLALIVGGVEVGKGGVRGLEKTQDAILRGTSGSIEVEHDKYGRELPLYRGEVKDPIHGRDIHLTIDMQIQDAADRIVEQANLHWKPKKIMAVVTEVGTGSVLAMSFRPDHDRKTPSDTNWKNLAIYEPYEPGSTFKIVAFTGALDSGKINTNSRFDCELGDYIDPIFKVPLHDLKAQGVVPVTDVFKYSSNIGTFKVYKRLGQETFLDYVRGFGFGSPTRIELDGEAPGYINEKAWSNSTHSRFPIGYEVNVTPMQMAMAYGAIANGGILMKPRLVDRIVSDGGRKEEVIAPEVVRQICKGQTAKAMRELLELVVNEGTGSLAKFDGLDAGGKTGTSRRYDADYIWRDDRGKRHKGGYPEGQWITSFAGFAPAKDPKIACVVVLDYPKCEDDTAIGGGKVAAPIFGEIASEVLKQLSVRPPRPLAQERGTLE
jgi:cell division protein FtsI/penicillin-binding protein 2